ncbi:adenylyl cyclase-associated protein 1 [Neocallimastix lanati (nom. inval.)]|jgi:adenylyl cyclase-associated protein|uniref:Adenylyl cyclase-associated protein n=1 Tax=Neocallimastix californiae TaxID=1754190 RepID=A0A1Y1YY60_9FUNG|nr:adenylyl cyclase-associated protein 1 [Neocallimastix sp. JGI-2020a]ORY02968.1 adenylyl cyclase-associated protein 1 [Neocallimastix californiae]|eukprot:ORY02968.1 adenylyl cyclase-associated protein 1 [Neocallimastix californiae]
MSESALNNIIKRLEVATNRLEELAKNSSFGQGASSGSAANSDSTPAIQAFDDIMNGSVQKFIELSNNIGSPVKEQCDYFIQALKAQRQLIVTASKSKKPNAETFKELINPIEVAMNQVCTIREQNRQSKLYNHLSTLSESILALGWVMVEPAPANYLEENINAAQYYINRVMKEFKEKEKMHVEWTASYTEILKELKDYVKKFHTTGLAWNPKGGNATDAKASAPAAAPAPAAATPAPKADASKLFAELNRGEGVTSGLRKVDPSERKQKPVSSIVKSTATPTKPAEVSKKPSRQVLEGNKWSIENFVGNKNIVIENTEIRHLVYIYNCVDSTIQIKGKVNAITIDNCKKTGIVIDSVVSAVDIVNAKSVQLQIREKAPTVSVDKTDGCQLYLSKECSEVVEIFSSKSSEMNVMAEQPDGDWTEIPIPEQFKTKLINGELVTKPVEHAG